MASDKRKQSLYFPVKYLDEIREESFRQDRSMSWLVQKAWELSREKIMGFPGSEDYMPGDSSTEDDE